MAYRNLIPTLTRLSVGRKQHLIAHIEALMQDKKNYPILEELAQFLRDIESRLTDLEKKARMGVPFRV